MYWAGGCPGRVQRSNKPYPGATRFFEPKPLNVSIPLPDIDWVTIFYYILTGSAYFVGVIALCVLIAVLAG